MSGTQAHFNHLGRTTLLVSLLVHLLVIKFFILTFTTRPIRIKPYFTFFGSILENRDFSELAGSSQRTTAVTPERFRIAYSSTYFSPSKITAITKPGYPLQHDRGEKISQKTTFLDEKDKQNKITTIPESDLYLPPIVPLHLYIRRW